MLHNVANSLILAQAIPVQYSFEEWYINALANFTGLSVLVSAILLFAGAVYLVRTQQPLTALAAYLVLLPLPTLIALLGTMQGMSSSFIVVAISVQTPSHQDYAGGIACSLVLMVASILATAPTYAILAFGLITRTLKPRQGGMSEATHPAIMTPLAGNALPATT